MSISSAGSVNSGNYFSTLTKTLNQSSSSTDTTNQDFIKLAEESPVQRMIDEWLRAHHLTLEQLNSMPPAQRDAIEKQMQQDIKSAMQKKTEKLKIGLLD